MIERSAEEVIGIELGSAYPWPGLKFVVSPADTTWAEHIWRAIQEYREDVAASSYSQQEFEERATPCLRFSPPMWAEVRRDTSLRHQFLVSDPTAPTFFGCPVYEDSNLLRSLDE